MKLIKFSNKIKKKMNYQINKFKNILMKIKFNINNCNCIKMIINNIKLIQIFYIKNQIKERIIFKLKKIINKNKKIRIMKLKHI